MTQATTTIEVGDKVYNANADEVKVVESVNQEGGYFTIKDTEPGSDTAYTSLDLQDLRELTDYERQERVAPDESHILAIGEKADPEPESTDKVFSAPETADAIASILEGRAS